MVNGIAQRYGVVSWIVAMMLSGVLLFSMGMSKRGTLFTQWPLMSTLGTSPK